jgi:hypothetical protein
MARRKKTAKRPKPKTVLRLPDLEQSKNAVLNSLAAPRLQVSYRHAIDEFICWYRFFESAMEFLVVHSVPNHPES